MLNPVNFTPLQNRVAVAAATTDTQLAAFGAVTAINQTPTPVLDRICGVRGDDPHVGHADPGGDTAYAPVGCGWYTASVRLPCRG